ncbi:MAG: hypothetical protein DRJ97_06660 [Thermoprotei archaeon]|nr:MAG: hypothetical protein DRJ97_06660 [Thermoprotei archaeon]
MSKVDLWRLLAVIATCWAIATSSLAIHYYTVSSIHPAPSAELGKVVLIVDYGNGTFHLYNVTAHLPTTLFNLTLNVAEVHYQVYSGLGVFVTSINGVANNPVENKYWTWWYWDGEQWVEGPVGAGQFELKGGEVVCWYYSRFDPATWVSEKPSSKIISVGMASPQEGSAG